MPIHVEGDQVSPVTLEEFKEHLNLSASSTADDAELARHLTAAVEAVEKRIGPILIREVTERLEARGGRLVVNHTPLVGVVSITGYPDGVAYTPATFDADPSGVVTGTNGWRLTRGRYDITYTAGRGELATDRHKLAILYVAEHFYEIQRKGATRPGLMGEGSDTSPGAGEAAATFVYRGFALPRRALELLAGDEVIGFA